MMTQPPSAQGVDATIQNAVGLITLGGPHARNGMDPDLLLELSRLCGWFAEQEGVRALVLRGDGEDFSAGMALGSGQVEFDPESRLSDRARQEVLRGVDALNEIVLQLRAMPYPTVAAIDGLAAGGGCGLALACDFRIATERARFFFAYGSIGAIPDGGVTQTLAEVVSPARALMILFEDKMIRGERARKEGLVHNVVPPAELEAEALKWAEMLAAKPPYYLAAAKRLVRHRTDRGLEEQLARERAEWVSALETEDVARAARAQLEGRSARFEGN